MNKKREIPKNMSLEEEAAFWENHDVTEYIDDTKAEKINLSPELEQLIRSRYESRESKRNYLRNSRQVWSPQITGNKYIVDKEVCRSADTTRYSNIAYRNRKTFEPRLSGVIITPERSDRI